MTNIARSAGQRTRDALTVLAGVLAVALAACGGTHDTRDESVRLASLDSAAAPGRNLLWSAHACMQRAQAPRSDTLFPATDSLLRADPACHSLPFGTRSADGWQLTYRRTGDTAGYELRADRTQSSAPRISLYSRVLAHEINADAAMIHAREGDSLATWSDPVIGSPLPMLVWVGWCLEYHHRSRDSGIEGYHLSLLPFTQGETRCLENPPFQLTADSSVATISANGLEYVLHYEHGNLEGESLSDLGPDGEMHTILEWQYNNDYTMTATPMRYGESGLRSYFIEASSGVARAWITPSRPAAAQSILTLPTEAPMCEWMRGTRCAPARPNPNDGTFGPGLVTILHPDQYKAH